MVGLIDFETGKNLCIIWSWRNFPWSNSNLYEKWHARFSRGEDYHTHTHTPAFTSSLLFKLKFHIVEGDFVVLAARAAITIYSHCMLEIRISMTSDLLFFPYLVLWCRLDPCLWTRHFNVKLSVYWHPSFFFLVDEIKCSLESVVLAINWIRSSWNTRDLIYWLTVILLFIVSHVIVHSPPTVVESRAFWSLTENISFVLLRATSPM